MDGNRGWLAGCLALTLLLAGSLAGGCSKTTSSAGPPSAKAAKDSQAALASVPYVIAPSPVSVSLGIKEQPSTAASSPARAQVSAPAQAAASSSSGDKGKLAPSSYQMYLSTHQKWTEGVYSKAVDLRDIDAVFWAIFSQLPDEVVVYPSENYYYFIAGIDGHQIWGNMRLPAGRRELGELSFAYFEYDEFAYVRGNMFSRAKMYTANDGMTIKEVDKFTYIVTYNKKSVTFNLLRLPQDPPRLFRLVQDEVFVMRTFDESGYQFFLLFNEAKRYFFWVLNEENGVPDTLDLMAGTSDILRGRRSGFVFWEDQRNDGRKVLVSVRQQSVERNDYFDGPFDQLADNYADETHISEFIVKAAPSLEGIIDKYGYYLQLNPGMRVALSMYFTHYYDAQVLEFIGNMRSQEDPYWYISRRGMPVYIPPASTQAPSTAPESPRPSP